MTEGEGKAGSADDATEPPSSGLTPAPDPAATPVTYGTTHTTSPRLNVIQQAEWTGPMPDPVSLGEFDRIVPGLAARMADEWEAEAAFRRGYMTTQAKHERRMEWAGLATTVFIITAALAVVIIALVLKQPWVAAGLGGVATLGAVIISRTSRKGSDSN